MIKENRFKLLISSVLILLPLFVGLIFKNEFMGYLSLNASADKSFKLWSGTGAIIVGMPLLMLALQWLCVIITALDPKNRGKNKKVLSVVIWIIPITELFIFFTLWYSVMGKGFNPMILVCVLIGLMFIVIGNYMPKCQQNYTVGIKIRWTLLSEENWNATHRFSGKVWMIGGILFLFCGFFSESVFIIAMLILIAALVLIPLLYSYVFYRKQIKSGSIDKNSKPETIKYNKMALPIVLVSAILIGALMCVFSFTGDIKIHYNSDSIKVEASYFEDITVKYTDIKDIEFLDSCKVGTRIYGFFGPRLSMGRFQSDELGGYIRYTYNACDSCILLTLNDKTVVINAKDKISTKNLYEEIVGRVDGNE